MTSLRRYVLYSVCVPSVCALFARHGCGCYEATAGRLLRCTVCVLTVYRCVQIIGHYVDEKRLDKEDEWSALVEADKIALNDILLKRAKVAKGSMIDNVFKFADKVCSGCVLDVY